MLKYHRGERRFQNRKCFVRFLKQEKRFFSDSEKMLIRCARERVHTRTRCSCTICASPRKLYGNGRNGKTRQELVKDLEEID